MVYVYDHPAQVNGALTVGHQAILGFSTTSDGNVAPVAAIEGLTTTISGNDSFGVAFDGTGSLYTASSDTGVSAIFPTGATGNVAPSGTLTNNTGTITGTSFDKAGDAFITATPLEFAANQTPYSNVDVFAKGAMGSSAPISTITIGELGSNRAGNSAVDSNGTLYVINQSQILIVANAATTPSNAVGFIGGANTLLKNPSALAFDSTGRLLVANAGSSGILIFAKGASGNIAPATVITGPATDLDTPSGVAVDGSDNIWVSDNGSVPEVLEFAAGSSLDATPMVQIAGSATTLEAPVDIAFVPSSDVTQSVKRKTPTISATRRFR